MELQNKSYRRCTKGVECKGICDDIKERRRTQSIVG